MIRSAVLALLLCLVGCTPLGIWVYEEPKLVISEIAIDPGQSAAYPVRVSLQISNSNDFEISLVRVRLHLQVAGASIVDRELATAALFAAREQQTVLIGVTWADVSAALRSSQLASGNHAYMMDGHAIVNTPIGERRIRFERTGTRSFGESAQLGRGALDIGAN